MPVFLSHKREDTMAALTAAQYLSNRGILFYLDVLDTELETVDDLTNRLVDKIRQSTHLLAVVSQYTVQSWWVPFEGDAGSSAQFPRLVERRGRLLLDGHLR